MGIARREPKRAELHVPCVEASGQQLQRAGVGRVLDQGEGDQGDERRIENAWHGDVDSVSVEEACRLR